MWHEKLHWWILLGIVLGALIGWELYSSSTSQALQTVAHQEFFKQQPDLQPESLPSELNRELALFIESKVKEIRFLKDKAEAIREALSNQVKSTFIYQCLNAIARVFIGLFRMIVVPLVFFTLVTGTLGLGDLKGLGWIGLKTMGWYVMTSFLAIVTGLAFVNLICPGCGVDITVPRETQEAYPSETVWDLLVDLLPGNVTATVAQFDMFAVIFLALLFGIVLLRIPEGGHTAIAVLIKKGAQVMMKITSFVLILAPLGILALVGQMVAVTGPHIFLDLIDYVLTVLVALGIHALVTLPMLFFSFTGSNPFPFMRVMSPALLTGFSTASSSGTLPVTLERAEKGARIPNRVASFVLPLGATINMDGTALYECVTVLFIAQVHGVSLDLTQQIMVVFLALTVSIGAAGIPHAGLVMMVIILKAVNLPLEYTGLIWSVDRVLDMSRTMVNIWSDSTGAYVIAHSGTEYLRNT